MRRDIDCKITILLQSHLKQVRSCSKETVLQCWLGSKAKSWLSNKSNFRHKKNDTVNSL